MQGYQRAVNFGLQPNKSKLVLELPLAPHQSLEGKCLLVPRAHYMSGEWAL